MRRLAACLLLVPLHLVAAGPLCVRHVVAPRYPVVARGAQVQGTVILEVEIQSSGRPVVQSASGGDPLLRKEAQKNLEQWLFGPFPQGLQFPIKHRIRYVYELQGERSDLPGSVIFDLPDQVRIVEHPPVMNE
jgi:TonB family protein